MDIPEEKAPSRMKDCPARSVCLLGQDPLQARIAVHACGLLSIHIGQGEVLVCRRGLCWQGLNPPVISCTSIIYSYAEVVLNAGPGCFEPPRAARYLALTHFFFLLPLFPLY